MHDLCTALPDTSALSLECSLPKGHSGDHYDELLEESF